MTPQRKHHRFAVTLAMLTAALIALVLPAVPSALADEARFDAGNADRLLQRYPSAGEPRVIHAQPLVGARGVRSYQPAAVVEVAAPRNSRAAQSAQVVYNPQAQALAGQSAVYQRQTIEPISYNERTAYYNNAYRNRSYTTTGYVTTSYASPGYYATYSSPVYYRGYDCGPRFNRHSYHRPTVWGHYGPHFGRHHRHGHHSGLNVGFYFRF